MIEPSDMERAELPECSAKYIEDLEFEVERLEQERERIIKDRNMYKDLFDLLQAEMKTNYKAMVNARNSLNKIIGEEE